MIYALTLRLLPSTLCLSVFDDLMLAFQTASLATLWPWWLSRVAEQNFYWEREREACLLVIHFCADPLTLSLDPDDFNAFLNSY